MVVRELRVSCEQWRQTARTLTQQAPKKKEKYLYIYCEKKNFYFVQNFSCGNFNIWFSFIRFNNFLCVSSFSRLLSLSLSLFLFMCVKIKEKKMEKQNIYIFVHYTSKPQESFEENFSYFLCFIKIEIWFGFIMYFFYFCFFLLQWMLDVCLWIPS